MARAHRHWHGHIGTGTGALALARAHWHGHGHVGTGTDWIWHWHHRRHGHWHHLGHHLAPPRIRLLRRRWTSNRGTFTINRYWHWHATWHHWHWHLWHGHWALWHGHLALWHGHWHYDWHDWHMMVAPSPKTDRSDVPTGPRSRGRSRLSEALVAKGNRRRAVQTTAPRRPPFPPNKRTHLFCAVSDLHLHVGASFQSDASNIRGRA